MTDMEYQGQHGEIHDQPDEVPDHPDEVRDQDDEVQDQDYEVEVLDGELVGPTHVFVPIEPDARERALLRNTTPAMQTAAAAATGFVAGAATLALLRRYGNARLERGLAAGRLPAGPGRTYIVHVRPLRTPPPIGPGPSVE
jgi:hypothetical protein